MNLETSNECPPREPSTVHQMSQSEQDIVQVSLEGYAPVHIIEEESAPGNERIMTKFQVLAEQTQIENKVDLSVHTPASVSPGALNGSPRHVPVNRMPSLLPNVALQSEASPPAGEISSSSRSYLPKYDLSKNAYVLVLHHDEFENENDYREGSMKDLEQIQKVLIDFRTDALQIHSNLPLLLVQQAMNEVSTKDFSKNSCLIVFIMSHGNTHDTIMAYDGKMYSLQDDVVEKCTKNDTLKEKPKIFVVQACRGKVEMQTDATRKIISDKQDVVIFQSTYKGTVAYGTENGTFFMQQFLSLLKSCDENLEIDEINTHLNDYFAKNGIKQRPTMSAILKKRLILNDLRKYRS